MSDAVTSHVSTNNDNAASSAPSFSLPKSSSSSRLEHLQGAPNSGNKHRSSPAMTAAASSPASPHFFNGFCSLSHLPAALLSHYSTARSELEQFDHLMRRKASDMAHKLDDIDVVVGIPFYTEITNIISVLVTLKEVFQQRRQRACLLVIGEFSRSDHGGVDPPAPAGGPGRRRGGHCGRQQGGGLRAHRVLLEAAPQVRQQALHCPRAAGAG